MNRQYLRDKKMSLFSFCFPEKLSKKTAHFFFPIYPLTFFFRKILTLILSFIFTALFLRTFSLPPLLWSQPLTIPRPTVPYPIIHSDSLCFNKTSHEPHLSPSCSQPRLHLIFNLNLISLFFHNHFQPY